MTGPYTQGADAYWQAGWRGILPLPPRRKKSPPTGYTGTSGLYPSYPDVYAWTEGADGNGNIALRMPGNILGIDVDAYGDKAGADTLTLAEAMHGPLPPTWRTTSRDDGVSGIRLFRVPEGLAWPGEIGPGVETVHRTHRYAVVWPSLHPEGRTYRWIGPDNIVTTVLPDPDVLPSLPETWVNAYTGGELAVEVKRRDMRYDQAIAWIIGQPGATDNPCDRMARVADSIDADLRAGSAHAAGRDAALRITRFVDEGHRGAITTLGTVRKAFIAEVTGSQRTILGKERRTNSDAEHEWNELVASAVGLVVENPTGMSTCDCDGQLTSAITGVSGANALAPLVAPAPITTPEAVPDTDDDGPKRMHNGAEFILDAPEGVPAVWGEGDDVFWAEGEALMIAGPPGVGKTTLTGQLVRGLLGLQGAVLGLPVRRCGTRVLYLAMDRPAQIARGLRRAFTEHDRQVLSDRLRVWGGPPPGDVAKHPDVLVVLAQLAGADTIIIDSLKDAAVGLTEDETAASYNRARQNALANGIQVLELHHMVKRGAGGNKPTELADVYGSAWLTAGAGSVVLLWGAAGDPIVELKHLKQPAGEVGPWKIEHDHNTGTSVVHHGADIIAVVAAAGSAGVTATEVAVALFDKDSPNDNDKQKARRRLDKLVDQGHAERFEEPRNVWGGGKPQHRFRSSKSNHVPTTHPSPENPTTPNHAQPRDGSFQTQNPTTNPTTPTTRQVQPRTSPPLEGGRGGDPVSNDLQVSCKTCFRPVGAATAKATDGNCPSCHAKAIA